MFNMSLQANISRLAGILFLVSIMMIIASCSDDDPTRPSGEGRVSAVIGGDGGVLALDDNIQLYVPAGTVSSPSTFDLELVHSPPDAPAGFMQFGSAFTARGDVAEGGGPMALAMEFDYSHYGELTGKRIRLSHWSESEGWEGVDGQGTSFPLGLGATVFTLGTFAAHIDTSTGDPEDVYAFISLASSFGQLGSDTGRSWSTRATASFSNFDQTEVLEDTGGSVRMGDFDLGSGGNYFFYHSTQHDILPGSSYHLRVPGGAEIPALDDSIHFFTEELVLTNPSDPGTTISRLEPFHITWDGAGPEMVWLTIYGDGANDAFVFQGKMRPNTGEFVLTPEDLGQFAENALVSVFLSRIEARPLAYEGYHRASIYYVESSSAMKMIVQ